MNIFPYCWDFCQKRKVVKDGHVETDENKADSHPHNENWKSY